MTKAKRSVPAILKSAFSNFGEDECGVRAAALAYYTVFALPPLLILLVLIAGKIWGPEQVQHALESQFAGMIGREGAQQVHQMIAHGQQSKGGGSLASIASIAGLLFGATGAFLSLQDALNRVWKVKPDPKQGGIRIFITKRLLSMGMVVGLGFLLAVSLALTAAISALGASAGSALPDGVMKVVDVLLSAAVLTLLFAALFKVLPDADVSWRDMWVGGAVTAVLFVLGKFVIGLYLGRSNPGDAFGAASALAVVLVWAYYAGMLVLFGAEFTREWATQRGAGVKPSEGAVRVVEKEVIEDEEQPRAAASTRAPAPRGRGGMIDWVLGLPILYVIFKGGKGRAPRA